MLRCWRYLASVLVLPENGEYGKYEGKSNKHEVKEKREADNKK
jgi:hypothetical protein